MLFFLNEYIFAQPYTDTMLISQIPPLCSSLCPVGGAMSLFKARDWWSGALGEGEEFDQGCLCVGDVDNSGTGHGQFVIFSA